MPVSPVRSRDRFLIYGAPVIEEAEIEEVVSSLRSGWLGTGPKVARFEEDFKTYKDSAHAIAVNSCTSALHLSLVAAGIGPGDEVITTPLTFCATVNAIARTGATPVLADVEPETMNIDPLAVEARLSCRTRAVLPVHFGGRPCRMDALLDTCHQHGLVLIEDCAHAIETEYRGRKAGTMGNFGCFSFYATKNITTGEGGMILARSAQDAERLRSLALHGLSRDAWKRFKDEGYRHYVVEEAGFKYNMMDLQAAIGIHQLKRVETGWLRRREIARRYDEALVGLPLGLAAPAEPDTRHAHHLYPILIDEEHAGIARDAFLDSMTAHNIGVGVHYLSLPEHPYYQERFGWQSEDYPNAMRIGRQTVSLPLSAGLTDNDVEDVIEAVRRCVVGGEANWQPWHAAATGGIKP